MSSSTRQFLLTAVFATALAATAKPAAAAEKDFVLNGLTVRLEEITPEVDVFFQSMRLVRPKNVWNVEVNLRSKSQKSHQGPIVLLVESFTGTPGPQGPDGLEGGSSGKAFYDFTSTVGNATLAPRENSRQRTLVLGFQPGGSPQLVVKVYARAAEAGSALNLVRTLNEVGQPLPSVSVTLLDTAGPEVIRQSDEHFALASLEQNADIRALRFNAPGYLPVWRLVSLTSNQVEVIPSPRLTPREAQPETLTPINGGKIKRGDPSIEVAFKPAAFFQDATGTLTPLTPQTLPLFLPQGWSPLQAFWLELSQEPTVSGTVEMTPWGRIEPGETAVLVRLNQATLIWEAVQLAPGNGAASVTMPIGGGGAYALVVGDIPPLAPPAAQPGTPLRPSSIALPDAASLRAIGKVTPKTSPASRVPQLVTGTAEVMITNLAGNLPSGLLLRGEVNERYALRDGSHRFPPQFDSFVVGYQRPGDASLATLHSTFPLRPLLLFGPEELAEAVVQMDLFPPGAFGGTVLGTNGGLVVGAGVRLFAGPGDLLTRQAVQFKSLDVTNFTELAGTNFTVMAGFEVGVSDVAAGHKLIPQFGNLPTNASFVLARVLAQEGVYGLEPRERFHSDPNGNLVSDEPAADPKKLPGLNGAGQYLLLGLNPQQGVVSGVVRNSAGQPAPDLMVRIAGQPWLAFSGADGAFKLLAPTGSASVVLTDLRTTDTSSHPVSIADIQTGASVALATVLSGPRVVGVSPAAGASGVSRVSPIVIDFDKPINAGTLGTGGIVLLDTTGTPVPASLSLNLRGTTATLLPVNPLSPSTRHTLSLSTNVADVSGRKLEGTNLFTFTTESDALNRAVTQLTIYEPTSSVVPVFGTPGAADPESPVILVNQTTGDTATILSRTDGSFTNSIQGEVDDIIEAVLLNRNGTRTTLTASRQIFRDGSVGLFNGGGVIEAQGEGRTVQFSIDPGAIAHRTRFKMLVVGAEDIQKLTTNAPPEIGKLLGPGIQVSALGDSLEGPADLSFPVTAAELAAAGLPAGANPTNAGFALMVLTRVNGNLGYMMVDKMEYEDGKLVTHSPPFPGANFLLEKTVRRLLNITNGDLTEAEIERADRVQTVLQVAGVISDPLAALAQELLMLPMLYTAAERPMLLSGTVAEVRVNDAGTPLSAKPLPGALVTAKTTLNAALFINRPVRLDPGAIYCVSQRDGKYAIYQPPTGQEDEVVFLRANHPRYLGQRVVEDVPFTLARVSLQDLVFKFKNSSLPDQSPPALSISHSPQFPAPKGTATLRTLATHPSAAPEVQVTVAEVTALTPDVTVTSNDVTIGTPVTEDVGSNGKRFNFPVTCLTPARVKLNVRATVGGAQPAATTYVISFGGSEPPAINPTPADPTDQVGPRVIFSRPVDQSHGWPLGEPIRIQFSEAIDSGITNDLSPIQLTPPAGTPVVELSRDQTVLTLTYYNLQKGTDYTLKLFDGIKDISPTANPLDQIPQTSDHDPFTLRFTTANPEGAPMPGISFGGGAVQRGIYAYVLERTGTLDGSVVVYDLSDPANPAKVSGAELSVPGYPRDLALIPSYAFVRGPGQAPQTNDLLAVVGGKNGGTVDNQGTLTGFQYLWVIDISNPVHPVRLASTAVTFSPSAAVTKVQWSPPFLTYLESDADAQRVALVKLQTFIYGLNLTPAQLADLPIEGTDGTDANHDGDYVDTAEGDVLPLPSKSKDRFAGLVSVFLLDDSRQRIQDYHWDSTRALLGVAVGKGAVLDVTGQPTGDVAPAAYRTLYARGLSVNRTNASVTFPTTMEPKRVFMLPGSTLTTTNGERIADLALVSVNSSSDPPKPGQIIIIDITDPTGPVILGTNLIPVLHGFVQSIEQREDGKLLLATSRDVLVLDPRKLLDPAQAGAAQPSIVGILPDAGSGAHTFSGSISGLNVVSLGGKNSIFLTPPRLDFVSFEDTPPFLANTLVGQNDALREKFAKMVFTGSLVPARFRTETGVAESTLSPPKPNGHYYVLVHAPGSAGETIPLSLESLNAAGEPLRNKGLGFPPVRGLSSTALSDLDATPDTTCDATIRTLTAWRLSANKGDPLYNVYLSRPFALIYEAMSKAEISQLQNDLDRDFLWSGAFIRAGFDPSIGPGTVLKPFAGEVVQKRMHPGANVVAAALPADYVMGPNPSPVVGPTAMPGTFGTVSAHNGEFRLTTVDIALPSRRMPIVFQRTHAAQDLYEGPFGRGWDFNYNQRLIELKGGIFQPGSKLPLVIRGGVNDEIAEQKDVLLFNGEGRTLRYRFSGTNAPPEFVNDPLAKDLKWVANGRGFFLPPPGAFDMLVRFDDGRFGRLSPDGTRTWYGADGRLEKIQNRYPTNTIVCDYNDHGELVRIEDKSVKVDRYLEIGYYRLQNAGPITPPDEQTSDAYKAGRVRRLRDYTGREVLFDYNACGELLQREGIKVDTVNSPAFQGRAITSYVLATSPTATPAANGARGVVSGTANAQPLFVTETHQIADVPVANSGTGASGEGTFTIQINHANTAVALQSGSSKTTITAPDSALTEFTLDPSGQPKTISMTGPRADEVKLQYEYDTNGLVTKVTYPEGNSVEFQYDPDNENLRSRANLRTIKRKPGSRGDGDSTPVPDETYAAYDAHYNFLTGDHHDANGQTITFAATTDGRDIGSISYPGAGTATSSYNSFGQLEHVTTIEGFTHDYVYDEQNGFLKQYTRGALTTHFDYPGDPGLRGRPGTVTPPEANTAATTLTYNERDELITIERGGKFRVRYSLDVNGNATLVSTRFDSSRPELTETREYLQNGFLSKVTRNSVDSDAQGGTQNLVMEFKHDALFRTTEIDHPGGIVQQFQNFDHMGRPQSMVLGDYTETYTYDLNGNLLTTVRGNATDEYHYDGHDRRKLTKLADKTGSEQIKQTFYGTGEVRKRTILDSAGQQNYEVEFTLDTFRRMTHAQVTADDGPADFSIQYQGLTETHTTPANEQMTIVYNAAGQVVSQNNSMQSLAFTVDGNDNVKSFTSTEQGTAYLHNFQPIDDLDHSTAYTDNLGKVADFTLRYDGAITAITDARNNITQIKVSQLGETLQVLRANGVQFDYGYLPQRDLGSVKDHDNKGRTAETDNFRLKTLTYRDGSQLVVNEYDDRNRAPVDVTIPGGNITLVRDPKGRILTRTVQFTTGTHEETFTYDALDRTRTATFPSGSASYDYFKLGPLREATYVINGNNYVVTHGIRNDGARLSIKYPGTTTLQVNESRDTAGRLGTVLPASGDSVVSANSYAAANRVGNQTLGPSLLQVQNTYDGRKRLTGRQYTHISDGRVLGDVRYAYDKNDNVVARQFLHRAGRGDFFQYDSGNRLTRADLGVRPNVPSAESRPGYGSFPQPDASPSIPASWAPGYFGRLFQYDANRDLFTQHSVVNPDGLPLPAFASSYTGPDDLLHMGTIDGFVRSRDVLGNAGTHQLVVRPASAAGLLSVAATLRHNGDGRLLGVQYSGGGSAVTVQYDYDHNGLCVYRKVQDSGLPGAAKETALIYDDHRLIEEFDQSQGANVLKGRYFYHNGDVPVAADLRDAGGQLHRYYVMQDLLGSVMGLVDSNGLVVERYFYDAWGQPQIEQPDTSRPKILRVRTAPSGFFVEFTERILPPASSTALGSLVSTLNGLSGALVVTTNAQPVPGEVRYAESVSGFGFGTVLHFVPNQALSGVCVVTLQPGRVVDEWNNPNDGQTLQFTFNPTTGALLFQDDTATSTAPVIIARSAFGWPFLFHGQYFDYDAGLCYLRARFYDPSSGLFLEPDPLGYEDSVNLYAAFSQNPISLRDPTGLAPKVPEVPEIPRIPRPPRPPKTGIGIDELTPRAPRAGSSKVADMGEVKPPEEPSMIISEDLEASPAIAAKARHGETPAAKSADEAIGAPGKASHPPREHVEQMSRAELDRAMAEMEAAEAAAQAGKEPAEQGGAPPPAGPGKPGGSGESRFTIVSEPINRAGRTVVVVEESGVPGNKAFYRRTGLGDHASSGPDAHLQAGDWAPFEGFRPDWMIKPPKNGIGRAGSQRNLEISAWLRTQKVGRPTRTLEWREAQLFIEEHGVARHPDLDFWMNLK